MENREHFGSLTARMKAFREEVLDEKPYVDAERAILATQAYQENQNQPRVMARALMLKKILENMTIYIEDKTLLAGNQATKNVNAPIFPEYTMGFVLKELDLFESGTATYSTSRRKPSSSCATSRRSGKITIFAPEARRFCLTRSASLWRPASLAWRASSTRAMRIWRSTIPEF